MGKKLSAEHRAKLSAANTRHGHKRRGRRSPEYVAYYNARQRCDPRHLRFKDYGGRGIKFLFTSFEQWLAELGRKPSPTHTVDRKDNDGNYELGNIEWTTVKQQRANRRDSSHA